MNQHEEIYWEWFTIIKSKVEKFSKDEEALIHFLIMIEDTLKNMEETLMSIDKKLNSLSDLKSFQKVADLFTNQSTTSVLGKVTKWLNSSKS